jgi:adenylate cyclase
MSSGAENDREVIRDQAKQENARAERLRRFRERAVKLDSQPRLLDATRRLRNRLPGDEKFGDPLSTAGAQPLHIVARGVSALQPDRESVAKELGMAGLQVWQSLSEGVGRGRGDLELALLFTDLVGFSSWALGAGDAAALELLREVGLCVEKIILAHQGRIVKRLGDGLMATFLNAQAAVEAALECQERVGLIDVDGYRPQMRAGIHWGRPRKLGDDYLGVDVNVAARVADAAEADQVLVSDSVLQRIDLEGLTTSRPHRLKAEGTPRSLQVIRLSRE